MTTHKVATGKAGKNRNMAWSESRKQSFEARIVAACDALKLTLQPEQIDQLLLYLEQMHRWNRVYNLTAIRDPEQMLTQHIFDSLAVIPVIYSALDKKPVDQITIVDVGSGAGLPGVVLAIVAPWDVHCVDSVQKKMAFVQQMAGKLQLPNLNAHHARIERLDPFNADIVISRAFSSLADFTALAGRHLSADGCMLAMKGRLPDDEIAVLKAAQEWNVDSVETLSVPELDAQRCVLRLSRQG